MGREPGLEDVKRGVVPSVFLSGESMIGWHCVVFPGGRRNSGRGLTLSVGTCTRVGSRCVHVCICVRVSVRGKCRPVSEHLCRCVLCVNVLCACVCVYVYRCVYARICVSQ